jgi:hypothetical protein
MTGPTHRNIAHDAGKTPENPIALLIASAASAGLLMTFAALAPLVPAPPMAAYVLAFGMVMGCVLACAWVAPVVGRISLAAVTLPVVGVLVTLYLGGEQIPPPFGAGVVTISLLLFGGVLGGAVGGRIEHPGHLLAVAVVSLLVDTFSVYHPAGPTAAVVAQPRALAVLALPWPMLGGDEIVPILGVGDVVFAALYVSASRRHSLGTRRTAAALAAGLMVTMIAVIFSGLPIPALVGMGLAVLAVHPAARRLPEKDRRLGRIVLGIMTSLWVVVWLRNLLALSGE